MVSIIRLVDENRDARQGRTLSQKMGMELTTLTHMNGKFDSSDWYSHTATANC